MSALDKLVLVNKTTNGRLSFCECCNTYQLEFGNVLFSFSQKDFDGLKKYVGSINGEDCLRKNSHLACNRKIFLSFPVKGLFFCLNIPELEELKALLFIRRRSVNDCEKLLALQEISSN